ncbi:MAG: alanine--tRNA ligase [Alphaproteobacteria bacterium]
MTTGNDIRQTFLDFFQRHGHEIVSSSPLVPRNDPTLMFTNAGMVQFKNVFTGVETRSYKRATTSQKCVRAGGKHNDLENVGYTARHHTFFEMLGNFSFGDYFKELAIDLAWKLITQEYGLPKEKLLATVYAEDDEAFQLWKKIAGLPESRIIRIGTADNFWAMGDTGPCGPCSEIFFDHGDKVPGGPPGSADQDGDRFIEIWNLVFMQYEQITKEKRESLPKPSIDTGMGLERLTAVLEGKHDNYDTSLLWPIIEAAVHEIGAAPKGDNRPSYKAIADHLRATSFLIADGVLPSNEGRGYVLRRIMRRAMRHAHILGSKDPVMFKLVPTLARLMGAQYPELIRAEPLIVETLKLEESRFKTTLERGLKLLEEETGRLGKTEKLSGEVAFKLYDTFGFPLDLTQDVLRGQGRAVDLDGFNAAMERQKAEARRSWAGSGEQAEDKIWLELREQLGATEFLGYETETAQGQITALVVGGKPVDRLDAGAEGAIVVNQTPFYAESGGQMGDVGIIRTENGAFDVRDTIKRADLHIHVGNVAKGNIAKGNAADLLVDHGRRTKLRSNHSVTHLAHEALRRVLGGHVTQKGSQVGPDRMRFDFSHPKALSEQEIEAVEADVNARIRRNSEVTTRLMTPDAAVQAGALALFGEKYGDEVRVVSMGEDDDKPHYSTELCGGTHVKRTGDIGLFKIVGESAVAAGVRRIEVVTGRGAEDYVRELEHQVNQAAAVLKAQPSELPARIAALLEDRKKLERDLAQARKQIATGAGSGQSAASAFKDVGGVKFAARNLDGVPAKDLKPMADELKKQIGSGVVAIASSAEGKASLVVAVTDDLTAKFDAVELVRVGSAALGGKGGGGRPDMAQAGGPDPSQTGPALDAIEKAVADKAA